MSKTSRRAPGVWRLVGLVAGASVLLAGRGDAATIPAGTAIVIRTIDRVESESSREGKMFRVSLAEPLVVDGKTLAPVSPETSLKITERKEAGKVRGNAELTVTPASLTVNGKMMSLFTENSTTANGGKKGAEIGAGAGAASGVGVAVVMSGPGVVIRPRRACLSW